MWYNLFIAQITPGGNPWGWNNQLYNPIDAKGSYTRVLWISIGVLVLLTILIFIWGHRGFPLPEKLKWLKGKPKAESEDEAFNRMCVFKLLNPRERDILKSAMFKVDPKMGLEVFKNPEIFNKLQLTATGRDLNTLKDIRLKIFGKRD